MPWCDLASSTIAHQNQASQPLRFSLESFPESARVKNETGLPWGAVATPWTSALWRSNPHSDPPCGSSVARHLSHTQRLHADDVPTCQVCGGWLNATCMMQRDNWHCSLCGQWNALDGTRPNMLAATTRGDHRYPEMNRNWAEFRTGGSEKHQIIAHVLVLDLSVACAASSPAMREARLQFFQAARKGLTSALRHMASTTWIALMCVDDSAKVTFCDVHGMRQTKTTASPATSSASPAYTPRFLKSFVSDSTGTLLTPLVDLLQGTKWACNVGRRRQALLTTVHTLLDNAIAAVSRVVPALPTDLNRQRQCAERTRGSTRACLLGVLEYLSSPPPSASSCRGDPTFVQPVVAARVALVTPGWSTIAGDSTLTKGAPYPSSASSSSGNLQIQSLWKSVQQTMATCGVCLDV